MASIFLTALFASVAAAADAPASPRIDFVVPLEVQPSKARGAQAAVIWHDDFDDDALQLRYAERGGRTTEDMRLGDVGKSLRMHYVKGKHGSGGRKVFFGDSPTYGSKVVRKGETFTDVYWRIYVKHEAGWTGGGPAKLSRATSIVPPGWRQAMIAHVWSSGESLTLDPASGVRDGKVVTRRYNDFPNLRWLGNRPVSRFKIHSREESGWWVCVEARARLNTPGKKDGLQQLWIDGRLESERRSLDWRGTFTDYGINAVFLEAYWNRGSPVNQSRWIDHFVISTEPIGPLVCSRDPVLVRATQRDSKNSSDVLWEAELAVAKGKAEGATVWRSTKPLREDRVRVSESTGEFVDSLRGKRRLAAQAAYRVRVRQRIAGGAWSAWSPWHQTFRTAR